MSSQTQSRTAEEEWEEHNEGFRYDWPDEPPEMWSSDQYDELHDRFIRRIKKFACQKCEKRFSTVEKARRHVGKQHGDHLYEKAAVKAEEEA
jgi:hypothetical protein